ncbi:MAG: DUF4395 domain-containing protein, partial [Solirubrobacterales bacterium]|nr:DUF4395 domain-containing protein [Solirubrobacterales bacterium]
MLKQFFSFPNPVNEISARIVASGVVVMCMLTIVLDQPWMTAVIAYGFIARVLTGPTMSPLGQLAVRVITPRIPIEPQYCPGPPKRFAQGIGVAFSVTAAVLALGFGETPAAYWVLGGLTVAASLEAYLGICLGCKAFGVLMKLGVIPEEVCERCSDIWAAPPVA